jgi:hypothetical protein
MVRIAEKMRGLYGMHAIPCLDEAVIVLDQLGLVDSHTPQ